ncbi:hypothetical protein TL16_g10968 [Triparma laevis f. inornata]|uniref:Holocytochrome c-type synthase n=1 Tax=Triparma laevis f. inornata TaxID=1714386 RepID=A0A9W7EQG4_9STRA|nr:hypothetical protein TL16_g10968 [Triparma laevis f. inornata]
MPPSLEESASHKQTPLPGQDFPLHTHREVSSIPKSSHTPNHQSQVTAVGSPEEKEKWVYPSEQQYYNAVMRKGWKGISPSEIPEVVRIHNFVNERGWAEVCSWEEPHSTKIKESSKPPPSNSSTPSPPSSSTFTPRTLPWSPTTTTTSTYTPPKLIRFLGRPTDPSPKSFLNLLLGYKPPFDRHDWIISRTRTTLPHEASFFWEGGGMVREEVRYVIDFYEGGGMGCFLDVRPAVDGVQQVLDRIRKFK